MVASTLDFEKVRQFLEDTVNLVGPAEDVDPAFKEAAATIDVDTKDMERRRRRR